ncbi:hypothetical protein NQ317_004994 [Molorchus minor]|uniref:Uncharacterized protein n=1 Tax=Molorchus minor TaxID=1323400 RepID=A0ABQ9K297_9CUCU|nr:hypothetical protein NQ317_004994 [Molorchus minor]
MVRELRHGFPFQPTAMAYDPVQKLLAIGTKSGSLRMYPFNVLLLHIHKVDVVASRTTYISITVYEEGWRSHELCWALDMRDVLGHKALLSTSFTILRRSPDKGNGQFPQTTLGELITYRQICIDNVRPNPNYVVAITKAPQNIDVDPLLLSANTWSLIFCIAP